MGNDHVSKPVLPPAATGSFYGFKQVQRLIHSTLTLISRLRHGQQCYLFQKGKHTSELKSWARFSALLTQENWVAHAPHKQNSAVLCWYASSEQCIPCCNNSIKKKKNTNRWVSTFLLPPKTHGLTATNPKFMVLLNSTKPSACLNAFLAQTGLWVRPAK